MRFEAPMWRLGPVTLRGRLPILPSQPLRLALTGTPLWMNFAHGALGLIC